MVVRHIGISINGRNDGIWTRDLFVPNEARYQAAPHSELPVLIFESADGFSRKLAQYLRLVIIPFWRTSAKIFGIMACWNSLVSGNFSRKDWFSLLMIKMKITETADQQNVRSSSSVNGRQFLWKIIRKKRPAWNNIRIACCRKKPLNLYLHRSCGIVLWTPWKKDFLSFSKESAKFSK